LPFDIPHEGNAPDGAPSLRLLGLQFADLTLPEVVARLAARPATAPFSYVVTPNADHLVRLARFPALRPLYHEAGLRLLDSRVVARLARLMGLPAPPVVPGSDLVAALVRQAIAPDEPVTILGLRPEAVGLLRARTGLSRIAHHDPPMGFEHDPAALAAALDFIEAHPARFTFLAVGSPRQCMVANALARRGIARGTGLCIGASLLFLCGLEKRAPRPVQQAGLEWAWRLAANPRRLARRYLVDSPAILALLRQEARLRRS
jgi:N-acetylglucosaminyldiphosphoundecaprenol N-acetyl-beta-D-mannosaminyltransferase